MIPSPVARISRRSFLLTAAGAVVAAGAGTGAGIALDGSGRPLAARARVGAYVHLPGVHANPLPEADLAAFERRLGRRFGVINYYYGWNTPLSELLNATVPERRLMVSWIPTAAAVREMHTGSQDSYIAHFARAVKQYDHVVYLRFAPEMNGEWNAYCAAAPDGPSAEVFQLAWHRVVGIFRAVHAHNAKFVWCPNEVDEPDLAGNRMEDYWPGRHWVDILGFDGYNWSVGAPRRGSGAWRGFDEICAGPYARVGRLAHDLPIWVCETGCTEAVVGDPPGVSKGRWLLDLWSSERWPRLAAVVYFSADDPALERNWSIDTSPAAVAGWRRGVTQ